MELRNEIIADFKDLDPRVIKFLDRIISELETNNTVNEYSKSLLGMLVLQLVIYYKASDEVATADKLAHEDNYKRVSKNPALQVLMKAHDQILVLLDKLAISPYSSAKVKKLQHTDDGEKARELLVDLIG